MATFGEDGEQAVSRKDTAPRQTAQRQFPDVSPKYRPLEDPGCKVINPEELWNPFPWAPAGTLPRTLTWSDQGTQKEALCVLLCIRLTSNTGGGLLTC